MSTIISEEKLQYVLFHTKYGINNDLLDFFCQVNKVFVVVQFSIILWKEFLLPASACFSVSNLNSLLLLLFLK